MLTTYTTADAARGVTPAAQRRVAVVLRDVSPFNWDRCERLIAAVQQVARAARTVVPLTLLVVPARGGVAPTLPFVQWLRRLAADGHEFAIHGLTHIDEAEPPDSLVGRLKRDWWANGEGEFAAISRTEAARRLGIARQWAGTCGLAIPGFAAPRGLLSPGAWSALCASGFEYTCMPNRLVALPGRQDLFAPGLVYGAPASVSRTLAALWSTTLALTQRNAPLVRLELHPGHADEARIRHQWQALLGRALEVERRVPARLSEAAAMARALQPAVAPPRPVRRSYRRRLRRIP